MIDEGSIKEITKSIEDGETILCGMPVKAVELRIQCELLDESGNHVGTTVYPIEMFKD